MPPFPALVGPSQTANSRIADFERTVGFFLEKNDGPGAVYPASLRSFPGLTSLINVPNESPGRGVWAQDGRCLRVTGAALYEITSILGHTLRGAVLYDTTPVQFASS